jgi:hypothetical protein
MCWTKSSSSIRSRQDEKLVENLIPHLQTWMCSAGSAITAASLDSAVVPTGQAVKDYVRSYAPKSKNRPWEIDPECDG